MVRPIDEVTTAWAALSGTSGQSGWQSIPIQSVSSCVLHAARSTPDNHEALLIGFSSASVPKTEKLPEGRGFSVARVEPPQVGSVKSWLAVSRQQSGSVELFAAMVADILGVISAISGEDRILFVLLGRIRAWQDFMQKDGQPLGLEAEVGLIGELKFLHLLLDSGFASSAALESWVGPIDGQQDFFIGTGAVEVKSTLATSGFTARIGSLEQLDDSVRTPLFIAAQRLSHSPQGQTLPALVSAVSKSLQDDPFAIQVFHSRLLSAGFLSSDAARYSRAFCLAQTALIKVVSGFPRLTTGTVPAGVRKATYELDLAQFLAGTYSIEMLLNELGVS